jgi:hypothetical protein
MTPFETLLALDEKGKENWTKEDKETYKLSLLLLNPKDEFAYRMVAEESPDLHLTERFK